MGYTVRVSLFIVIAGLLVCLTGAASYAAEGEKGWEFTIAPYAWLTGIDGDVSVRDHDADISMDFGDVWDSLEFTAQVQMEARKDRFGVFLQPNYLRLASDATYNPRGGSGIEADLSMETFFLEFGGFYRVAQWSAAPDTRPAALDILAGGRYWDFKNELDFDFQSRSSHHEKSTDLIDPMIGLRFSTYLTDKFLFNVRGDIAGFGLSGSTSDFTWNAVGVFGYEFSKHVTGLLGYRGLGIDFGGGDSSVDMTMYGPIVGVGFKF